MGKIIVSKNAIAKLATLATMECYGVVGLVPTTFTGKVLSLLGKAELTKAATVEIKGKKVKIDIYVVLQSGVKVSEVANTIISQVEYKLKKLTGLKDIDVNVIVAGIKREV
jgi:uncharacterized alkaline shock family protein YloU